MYFNRDIKTDYASMSINKILRWSKWWQEHENKSPRIVKVSSKCEKLVAIVNRASGVAAPFCALWCSTSYGSRADIIVHPVFDDHKMRRKKSLMSDWRTIFCTWMRYFFLIVVVLRGKSVQLVLSSDNICSVPCDTGLRWSETRWVPPLQQAPDLG